MFPINDKIPDNLRDYHNMGGQSMLNLHLTSRAEDL